MATSAIILSGGRSRRFGGVHKPGVELGGQTVISRIMASIRAALPTAQVWVAGETDGLSPEQSRDVVRVREEPEFSGPLAGIDSCVAAMSTRSDAPGQSAALDQTPGFDVTLVVAGDMPLVTSDHLGALVDECSRSGGPVSGLDEHGRLQLLCAAWPTTLLRSRLAAIGETANKPVRLLYEHVETALVDVDPQVLADFDTREDFDRIRRQMKDGTANRDAKKLPVELLEMRDRAKGIIGAELGELTDSDLQSILDFASKIKHSDSSLSPVLAALLGGITHATRTSAEDNVADSLTHVEEAITRVQKRRS